MKSSINQTVLWINNSADDVVTDALSVEDTMSNTPPLQQRQHPAVLRRFALFVDGMSRAMLLPFGPTLVLQLISTSHVQDWSGAGYYLAWVVAVYSLGHWFGSVMVGAILLWHDVTTLKRLPRYVARLGGAVLTLHSFTYAITSVQWLLTIRFLSALLAGLLYGLTSTIELPEDEDRLMVGHNMQQLDLLKNGVEGLRRREGYDYVSLGTVKIYLTGSAVSTLVGGLLFQQARNNATFQALAMHTTVPIFMFVGVAAALELILRSIFAHQERRPLNIKNVILEKPWTLPLISPGEMHSLPENDENKNGDDNTVEGMLSARYYDADAVTVRSRVESFTSIDEYFDCQSILSGDEGVRLSLMEESDHTQQQVALYINGRCQYGDGSPAFVPQGDSISSIPTNYLTFYNHNQTRAQHAWRATQHWRRIMGVYEIHTKSNLWFPKIKMAYPHFIHGHSKAGYPIVYEQPGRMNLKDLFRNGCEIADMVRHYTFFMEYIANCVCTREEIRQFSSDHFNSSSWGVMVVMDIKGAGLSHLSGDVVKYLKQAGDINSAHYPMSMKRAFLVNSPFWLAGAWSGLKGILPESVQVDILSESNFLAALKEFIDDDQIPREYGGSSPYPLGEHPFETELRALVGNLKHPVECDYDIDAEHNTLFPSPPLKIEFPALLNEVLVPPQSTPVKYSNMHGDSTLLTPSSYIPMRRRVGSVDCDARRKKSVDFTPIPNTSKAGPLFGGKRKVFIIVAILQFLWAFTQGAIELALPLWLLSPTILGGLGYSPSRSGVSYFSACLVLLWTLRTKQSRLVSNIPCKSPLRAFRIGVGSEAALLSLLGCVSTFSTHVKRSDSVVVMTSTIILISSLALANMVGRSASKIIYKIAADGFFRQPYFTRCNTTRQGCRMFYDSHDGQFALLLNMVAEIAGILLVAPLWATSISSEGQAPFNATCILYIASIITFTLYVCSFTLHLNSAGVFAPHPNVICADSRWRQCLRFVCEVIAVSAGDIASLFEEANWSATPLLGRDRMRTVSEASVVSFADIMERGDRPAVERKAK